MRTSYLTSISLLVLAMLPACGGPGTTPPTTERVIGLIPTDRFPELTVLHAPPEVRANQPFTITVTTYRSSSCTVIDGAEVQVTGVVASITPYDRQPGGDVGCTADLAHHPRDVQVTLSSAGRATIRVIGQNFDGERTTNERVITVVP
jgi:hypothetical protein